MRMRLDLIDDLLQQHLSLMDTAPVKSDMMQEFEVVLTQMPYVGGAESRLWAHLAAAIHGRSP
jgi:hypothetical protein